MHRRRDPLFTLSWSLLAVTGAAILAFGIVTTLWPGTDERLYIRAVGVASVGLGLFGVMITLIPFRGGERWAWMTLWYYPAFWLAHLLGGLPPGNDHIHQIVFIVFSASGLMLAIGRFPSLTPEPPAGTTD
ncbi:MAG: hypothetical protein WB239_01810 [Acidimicrobiia bacterium]